MLETFKNPLCQIFWQIINCCQPELHYCSTKHWKLFLQLSLDSITISSLSSPELCCTFFSLLCRQSLTRWLSCPRIYKHCFPSAPTGLDQAGIVLRRKESLAQHFITKPHSQPKVNVQEVTLQQVKFYFTFLLQFFYILNVFILCVFCTLPQHTCESYWSLFSPFTIVCSGNRSLITKFGPFN